MVNRNDAILQLVLIRNNFNKAREHIISNHQNIDTNKDARITIFSKIIIVLDSTALYFILHQFHLTNLAWWKNISLKKIGDSKIKLQWRGNTTISRSIWSLHDCKFCPIIIFLTGKFSPNFSTSTRSPCGEYAKKFGYI